MYGQLPETPPAAVGELFTLLNDELERRHITLDPLAAVRNLLHRRAERAQQVEHAVSETNLRPVPPTASGD